MRSLIRAFASRLKILLLLSYDRTSFGVSKLKGGCTGSPDTAPVKMPHCWKSHLRLIYMGVKKNRLIEYPQHMIWLRMSKLIFIYTLLSRGLRGKTVINRKYLKPQILTLGQQSKTPEQNQTCYTQPWISLNAVHNCIFTVFVNFKLVYGYRFLKLLVPVGRNMGGVNQLFRCLFNFNMFNTVAAL